MEYTYFKLIHLLAVVLFLGNIITGLFWMRFAVHTKDLKIINHTMKIIIRLDKYLTIPGVIVITAGGIIAAINGRISIMQTGWVFWSVILFSISGIIFSVRVAPLQKRIYNFTFNKDDPFDFDWVKFKKMYLQWDAWGLVATLTPLAAFAMMVLKIPT